MTYHHRENVLSMEDKDSMASARALSPSPAVRGPPSLFQLRNILDKPSFLFFS